MSKSLCHWIIIKSGSSLDHNQGWIITASAISIKWCYLSILLVTGSSTDPALFHVNCRPRKALPTLASDHGRNTSTTMSERHVQHSHLTMGGTHPRTMSQRPNTYIWPWEEHIQEPCQKFLALTFTSMIGHTYYYLWKGTTLTSTSM